ncbi:hypothetical protein Droror1_Dr00005363 [Drosera rotundifolia]
MGRYNPITRWSPDHGRLQFLGMGGSINVQRRGGDAPASDVLCGGGERMGRGGEFRDWKFGVDNGTGLRPKMPRSFWKVEECMFQKVRPWLGTAGAVR